MAAIRMEALIGRNFGEIELRLPSCSWLLQVLHSECKKPKKIQPRK